MPKVKVFKIITIFSLSCLFVLGICVNLSVPITRALTYQQLYEAQEGQVLGASTPPTNGLVGYWPFDEGSGTTANDASGNGNTASLINGPTWATGEINGALFFSGSSQYVETNNVFNIGNPTATFTAWVKGTGNVMSQTQSSNGAQWDINASGQIQVYSDKFGWRVGATSLSSTAWTNIAVVSSFTSTQFYVNGSLDSSFNTPMFDTATYQQPINPLYIGFFPNNTNYFTGSIDEVRIYNRALSPSEIQSIYNYTGSPPDTTPPSVPTNLSATAISSSQINLSWTASTDNVGVTGYKIYRNGSQVGTSATNSYSDSGLSPSTQYTYTVSAYDAAGNNSAQSTSASATTQAPANQAPQISSFTSSPSSITQGNSSTLSWTVTGTPVPTLSINNGVGTVSGSSANVSPASTTTYTLTATNSQGNTTAQATVTVIPPDTTPPSTPQNLSATAVSSSQINLSWTASTDNVGVTGYKIYRNGSQVGTSVNNNYNDNGLTASTLYTYTVSAYDAAGNNSAQSTSASATTQAQSSGGTYAWSNIISPSRAINWANAGLPATFPDGETTANPWTPPVRATICATISPEGTPSNYVAPTDIQNAEVSCPPTGVVQLAAGTFYLTSLPIASPSYPDSVDGITLRGAGADKTFVHINGSGGASIGGGGNGTQYGPSVAVTGGLSQGSTQLTLSGSVPLNALLSISECDPGFSGSPCANSTDSQVDNGGLWICTGDGPWCSHGGTGNEGGPEQVQIVRVTASSGNTVTISPGIYLPNWSPGNTVIASYFTPPVYGVGLEDVTLDQTQSTADSSLQFCLGCWVKGVRLVGSKLAVGGAEHYLVENSYFVDYSADQNGYGITVGGYGFGDGLVLNNIVGYNLAAAADDGGEGAVFGYNYIFDGNTLSQNNHSYSIFFHTGGSAFNLMEGNETAEFMDDNIHGTHDLDTLFRNRFSGQNGAYPAGDSAVQLGQGTRFANIIGNVLGTAGYSETYQNSPTTLGSALPVYDLGIGATLDQQGVPYDILVQNSLFRWGNVTAYGGAVNPPSWTSSEVPSALNAAAGYQQQIGTGNGTQITFSGTLTHLPAIAPSGMVYDRADGLYAYDNDTGTLTNDVSGGSINYSTGAVTVTFTTAPANGSPVFVNYLQQTNSASPYQNPVPAAHVLPFSFIFPNLVAGSSGTNLPFGKVCTNYTTPGGCGGSYYHFPEPGIGPDVSGGNGPGGYSYNIPAEQAWANMPVDPAYQNSYSITGSSWSGGVETLTISGLPHALIGEFDVTGTSGCNGTEIPITESTGNTVSYALSSNPGSCGSGTFKFPDIRIFNEGVYAIDASSGGSGSAPTISSFTSNPSAISYGQSTTLSWSVTGSPAPTVSIDNGLGTLSGSSVSVSPTQTTTYTLTAQNSNGTQTSQTTVTVNLLPDTTPPTVNITSPSSGTVSGSITFSASGSDPNNVPGQVTSGLKMITLSIDNNVYATSSVSPASKPLDTTTLTNGSHTLTAQAVDFAANTSTISSVTITVNNTPLTKYPRLITLSSLEGIPTIPSSTLITATILSPSSGAVLETQTNLIASNGKYTITFLSSDPQLVNIRVKVNGYLSQLLTNIDTTINSPSALSVPQLSAGDFNNDNIVNSLDYSLMNSHWLQNYPTADINQDGLINSLDFAILKNNYGKQGQ